MLALTYNFDTTKTDFICKYENQIKDNMKSKCLNMLISVVRYTRMSIRNTLTTN